MFAPIFPHISSSVAASGGEVYIEEITSLVIVTQTGEDASTREEVLNSLISFLPSSLDTLIGVEVLTTVVNVVQDEEHFIKEAFELIIPSDDGFTQIIFPDE